jgi:hypothetical protein
MILKVCRDTVKAYLIDVAKVDAREHAPDACLLPYLSRRTRHCELSEALARLYTTLGSK